LSKQVTVPGQAFPIGLTLTTKTESNRQIAVLSWTRAQGPSVYLYRNGLVLMSTPNDGKQSVSRNFTGPATYVFKICEAGSTICSNPATAQFGGGSPPDNLPPNAAFTPVCSGNTCRFSDGSSDSDGTVSGWQWSFGDGSSSSQRNPSHTYAAGGEFTVTLTVSDNIGAQGSASKKVTAGPPENLPPAAAFTSGCSDLDCSFTDGSTDSDGSVTDWQWDFGDGSSSDQQNPSHAYAGQGVYTVSLTVTDDDELTGLISKQVTAGTPPNTDPVADFSSSCTGLTCAFTDQSTDTDGSVTGWSWSFGDGATSTVRNPNRAYASAGTYTVTLTATDNLGASHQRAAPVTVSAPSAITLTISGRTDAEKHYITHLWSGATGTTVDLYRNGKKIVNTPNDGRHTTAHRFIGTATWRVKVCLAGSTTNCSVERTITLAN
jgi:PKD repeat protein